MIHKDTPLKDILKLAAPCMCRSCSHGCKLGSGFLAGDDSKNMAKFLEISEEELKSNYLEEAVMFNKRMLRPRLLRKEKMPFGRCVFYSDEFGCTVHEAKPLQCKTSMGCKDYGEELSIWFMMNYILEPKDYRSMEEFRQYVKCGGRLIPELK